MRWFSSIPQPQKHRHSLSFVQTALYSQKPLPHRSAVRTGWSLCKILPPVKTRSSNNLVQHLKQLRDWNVSVGCGVWTLLHSRWASSTKRTSFFLSPVTARAYKEIPHPHLGQPSLTSLFLLPAYKQLLKTRSLRSNCESLFRGSRISALCSSPRILTLTSTRKL